MSTSISLEETIIFILINFILILLGIILWYYLWIKKKLAEIFQLVNNMLTYFSSRNLSLMMTELYNIITSFNPIFITKTIGYEAYAYLVFQRRIISLLLTYFLCSILLSGLTILFYKQRGIPINIEFLTFLVDKQYFDNINTVIHLISIALFTFLHFRTFTIIKNEVSHMYFSRFDKMSQEYDQNWLSCRTLHISGIAPEERVTSKLQKKLDNFLAQTNSGKVIDINFIPNYQKILQYEKKRNEIKDLRLLISKKKPLLKCCFSSIYWSDEAIDNELTKIENKLQELTEDFVYSAGHAFICFDSLTAAYQVLKNYKESGWKKFVVKVKSLFSNRKTFYSSQTKKSSTFQKFNDEYEENDESINDKENNVNILVDQLIEPCDIIWDNVGGDRGLFVCRRIILNLLMILLLFFFTTPASLFSTLKKFDYLKVLEFTWMIKIPYGYLLITYIMPLVILLINLGLITLIDYVARFEKHYTHSNYHYAVFGKSFAYMLLNFLIIPGLALTAESLFSIVKTNYKNIFELLSQIYLGNSGYFFITLVIQNGTISSIYYLLRLDELMVNAFSTEITYYKRHFINIGHTWHRNESDCFLFGYFYAQLLVFYTICLVFGNTMPIISLAGLYLFIFRHISDFSSFLMVHGKEIDSNGKLINRILNFAIIPPLLYHLFMVSVFLSTKKYNTAIGVGIICLLSIIYAFRFNSEYLIDIYALHSSLSQYEREKEKIGVNEINKWRNRFKHPLVIPIWVDGNENGPLSNQRKKEMELVPNSKSGFKEIKPFINTEDNANRGIEVREFKNEDIGMNEI